MSQKDITIVTNPGKPDMEMIVKRGERMEKLKSSELRGGREGYAPRRGVPAGERGSRVRAGGRTLRDG